MYVRMHGAPGDQEDFAQYIDTSLCLLPNPSNDDIKFVHAPAILFGLHPDTKREYGAMCIDQEDYDSNEGLIIKGSDVQILRENPYALPNVRRSFWEFAPEEEKDLATEYIDHVCDTLHMKFDEVMGLYLPNTKGMRLVCVGSVGDNGRSGAFGSFIGYSYGFGGRLVGIGHAQQLGHNFFYL